MSTIGLIGLGTIGAPVARSLVQAGYDLGVYDRVPDRVAAIEHVSPAEDARALAQEVDVVLCCVDGSQTALTIALGPSQGSGGVISELKQGALYIELTTMPVASAKREAKACLQRGVGFVECPVSGRPPDLTALLGGDDVDLARALAIVEAFAAHAFPLGGVGAASTAKLVNQFLTYANLMVVAQGLSVGARMGLAPTVLADALERCAGASRSLTLLATCLHSGTSGLSDVSSILHDIDLYSDLADDCRSGSRTLEELRRIFADAALMDGSRAFPAALSTYDIGL